MATNSWCGGAGAVAQVDTITPANVEIGDVFTITVNGKSVSFTATAATVANVTAGLTAAWNASTEPEHAEITAADATTHVTLTADTAGVPFTATSAASDGGGTDTQTCVRAASVTNSGPNDALVDSNWSTGDVPGGDDVVFEDSDVDCLYNLDQLGTTPGTPILTSLTVKSSYTGKIGLPRNNSNGYVEYRPTVLELGTAVTAITIGEGDGTGSGRINLEVGNLTSALAITIHKTAARLETDIPPVLITTGTQSDDTTMVVNRGDVGVAFHAGDSAVIDTLKMGYVSKETKDAIVAVGSGTTLTTVTKSGGVLTSDANATTLTNTAGDVTFIGSATLGTATLAGGTLYYNSSGTLSTVYVTGDSILDFRQDARSRIVTNATIYEDGEIHDPAATVTWTNGIDLAYCGISDITLDLGENITLTPS
jgi:hypothetical protein